MPLHFSSNNEDATPICNHDESAYLKLTRCKLILQHGRTIHLFVQNLPHKASNALKHGTRSSGDATFQNPTLMHRTLVCVTFQNLT
jgi:hypothetical protein